MSERPARKGAKLSESSIRLWRVAVEEELLNPKQMQRCRDVYEARRAEGREADLGEIMVELGYLTPRQLTAVRAEERKRRLSIRGYEILEHVGSGAVGSVYRARQISMDREVALKILKPELAGEREAVEKYISEARAVAKLNHPHIVQGIDVGNSGGWYYFAMEFLPGGTFAELLAGSGPLDEEDALVWLYQVASALEHAWKHGIIHRDIKPGNLMLDAAGRLKVTDLGLAAAQGGIRARREKGRRLVVVGTPHYVSPEQIRQPDELDCRTDIYSLGVTFYQLLSGKLPFSGESAKEIMLARLRKQPPSLLRLRPDLRPGLASLVDRMMARDREARPQTPQEIKQAVLELGVDVGSTGDLVGAIRTRGRKAARPSARARLARSAFSSPTRVRRTSRSRTRKGDRSWLLAVLAALAGFCVLAALLLWR